MQIYNFTGKIIFPQRVIRTMQKYLFILLTVAILTSCSCNRKQQRTLNDDNTEAQLPAKLIRFDKELFAVRFNNFTDDIAKLREKYGDFFELYCTGILNISSPDSSNFPIQLKLFLEHEAVKEAHQAVVNTFTNISDINERLQEGFNSYTKEFPNKLVPKVYAYISGFNQSLMLTDSAVGVSLDMFLGRNYKPYSQLAIPRYKQKNMYKERIPAEVIKAWAIGEYQYNNVGGTLLAAMLNEGKLLYFVKTMIPNEADTVIMGFTQQELQWCKDNERNMWMDLAENNLLFETSYSTVSRMIEDSPFTPALSRDTPGRACCWIGYRIVQEYMKKRKVTLGELMAEANAKKILETSKYNP